MTKEEENQSEGEAAIWPKAIQTEYMLRLELVLYKRLPKEVKLDRNTRNLIKLLLRINKLYLARASDIRILNSLVVFRKAIKGVIIMTEVHK